jgi:manganese transport protein
MDGIKVQLGLTDLTTQAIGEALARRRTTGRANLLFAGPAVLASIASMDPGNFAAHGTFVPQLSTSEALTVPACSAPR